MTMLNGFEIHIVLDLIKSRTFLLNLITDSTFCINIRVMIIWLSLIKISSYIHTNSLYFDFRLTKSGREDKELLLLEDEEEEVVANCSESCIACFKLSTTWLIVGLSLAFLFKQLSANLAIFLAAMGENWFLSRGSIIMLNLLLSAGYSFTQSRSFCSLAGRFLSNARLPVRISYSTTPKLHMSLWIVRWPVSTYSGAA